MPSNKKYLIVITGPTAVGKTALTIDIANHFNTEIISADSRQFYKEMAIGTAKPTPSELGAASHHFVDFLSINNDYSVGDFEAEAISKITELYKTHDIVILSGGSGLFINSILYGFDKMPEIDKQLREDLNQWPLSKLQDEIKNLDPEYASAVDINNPQRLVRALEICLTTGKPYSSFRKSSKVARDFVSIPVFLERNREELYGRINRRVDMMMEEGLLKEAKELYPRKHLNALQTVGYNELFDYWDGLHDLETAVELIKRNTRRYAKRQFTWFKKDDNFTWFHPEMKEKIIQFIKSRMA